MHKFDYHQPQTLHEAFRLMENHKGRARYVAGGTDLLIRIKRGAIQPDALVSLRGIKELRGIERVSFTQPQGSGAKDRRDGGVTLGGMTLIRDLEKDPVFTGDYPVLAQAACVLASPQIRNVATVGGNLANAAPSADCAPPLIVLDARLTLEGPGGKRDVPIDDFFTGPGRTCCDDLEIMTRITIPPQAENTGTAFLKLGRVSQDIAVINVAALLVMEKGVCRKCRLAVGGVAPIPLRLKKVEKVMEGREVDDNLLDLAGGMVEQEVSPSTRTRARVRAQYRRVVAGVMVRRALRQALQCTVDAGKRK